MANDITQNPLLLDTAATIAFGRPVLARRIEWYVPTTIGHQVIVQDVTGDVIIQGTCEVASQSQILWSGPQKLTLPGRVQDVGGSWQISSIGSGVLIIWY